MSSGRGEPHIQSPKDKEKLVGREMWWFEFPFGDLLAFSPHFCSCSITSCCCHTLPIEGAAGTRQTLGKMRRLSVYFSVGCQKVHRTQTLGAFTGPSWTISVPPSVHSHSTELAHPLQPFSIRLRTCYEEWDLDSGQFLPILCCVSALMSWCQDLISHGPPLRFQCPSCLSTTRVLF